MSLYGVDERLGRPVTLGLAWLALLVCACGAWFAFQGANAPAPLPARDMAGVLPASPFAPLRAGQLVLVFAMWTGLCVALMLPASAGAAFIYLRVARHRAGMRWPRAAAAMFTLGCLLSWTGFAALVTLIHWTLHDAGMLDPSLAIRHPAGAGLALVAAGVYQWTPAKHACLQYCRAPLAGVLADWSPGLAGALWQGAEHGRSCLGCCWLLLLLPLAGGPGNPAVVAAVGMLLLAELRLEEGPLAACVTGLVMVAWGTRLLFP
ncbi:copper chaperone [Massilia consociata]|uniref:DUF2182 domain-containing protein n=1 Tax=Massilia consociata TaxID=760117 RepID=A0ABV6FJ84_9BURK